MKYIHAIIESTPFKDLQSAICHLSDGLVVTPSGCSSTSTRTSSLLSEASKSAGGAQSNRDLWFDTGGGVT